MINLPVTKSLDLEIENGWLNIWFNEPKIRNALTQERIKELQNLCNTLNTARDVRGVTFRGRENIFCAGVDLKAVQMLFQSKPSRNEIFNYSKVAGDLISSINSLPQIVVMAVEGAAIAGGFGIACLGDFVLADSKTKFSLTETKLGLSPAQIAPYVAQRLGFSRARQLMLTGASFLGEEALAIGLVDKLTNSSQDMFNEELRIKELTLSCAPGAVAETKNIILKIPYLSKKEYMELAAKNFTDRVLSDEGREGVLSFIQKRKPSWFGK